MDIELPRGEGPRAPLKPPGETGYLLLAARTQRQPPFLASGRSKRRLVESIPQKLAELAGVNTVVSADLFVARLVAPGMGHELLRRRAIRPARFDVVVLVQTVDPAGRPFNVGSRLIAALVTGSLRSALAGHWADRDSLRPGPP